MKRFLSALCVLALLGSLVACQTAQPEPTEQAVTTQPTAATTAPAATLPAATTVPTTQPQTTAATTAPVITAPPASTTPVATTVPATTVASTTAPATTTTTAPAATTTTAPAAALTIVAEGHSYFGAESRYNISQLPEAKVIAAALENPDRCTHGANPTTGGALLLLVTKNGTTTTYATSECQGGQPVLFENKNIYHLAQEVSDSIYEYLGKPEARIDFVSARATHGNFSFRSEDAAIVAAVQTQLDDLTPGGKHAATTAACQKEWSIVCYQGGYISEYTVCTIKNDDGTVNVAHGYPGSNKTWYTVPGEILNLLR